MKRLLVAVTLVVAMAAAANAQVAGGIVTGTVRDEQGLVLPGAVVTLTSNERSAEITTDATGKFRFLNLAPGTYGIGVTLQGFSKVIQDNIPVRVGGTSDVSVTMKLAGLQEAITVSGSGQNPVLDTRSTGTSTNFTLTELEKIPTSRDPFAIIRAVPGVLVDRINIAGNETGQQSNVLSKGTRQTDAVWTLDGIVITDMASAGVSPIYYNFDNFEEIHVATAGQDISQPTGGLGVNLVVRRGTNDFHGVARGYFTNDALESENVPDELRATGVTGATADHNQQISDYGFDFGGPIVHDRLWFYGSYSQQDIRLIRTGLVDRTQIKNPYVKVNWQSTSRDLVSFLYFDGNKIKQGRVPSGAGAILFPAASALQTQENAYADNPFHGLWKLEDNHTFGSKLFTSGKFAYFNTGFELTPAGGLDTTSGRSARLSRSFGSVNLASNVRPQWDANVDATTVYVVKGTSNDLRFGTGWRRVDAQARTLWPGNGFLALDNSLADRRVRVFREGNGTNRVTEADAYVSDTIQFARLTIDAGVRVDHQTGAALASNAAANPTFPELVPGVTFGGFDLPFDWNTVSPRAGFTYALNENHRWILRGSVSRFAGQMPTTLASLFNPSTGVGFREFRWNDANGDQLATPDEVLLDQQIQVGGGFNPAAPTTPSALTPNQLGVVKPPRTTSVVGGVDFQIDANLALQANYSYTRTSNFFGNVTPRVGVSRSDYAPGPPVQGTLPDGLSYDIPTWIPNAAAVAAGGGGFRLETWPGYYTDYHGIEAALVKRLSGRWMGRVSAAWNNAREHYAPEGLYDFVGNPTRTDTEPLVEGGQYAPPGGATGNVFMNAKWQFNGTALYVLPHGIEASINAFGRQGYPLPPIRQVALGADALQVLLTPAIDTIRLPRVWDTDLRFARSFRMNKASLQLIADLFNVFNSNVALLRVRNAGAPNYGAIAQNLSPRIWRFGLRVSF